MISGDTTEGPSPVRHHTLTEKRDAIEVTAVVYELGSDCLVMVYGGTKPHIGAIGMGQVRPSLKDPAETSATSSVFTYVGHKEDVIAKALSEELTRRLKRNTVVVAGIHWDNLAAGEIEIIGAACRALTDRIIDELLPSTADET